MFDKDWLKNVRQSWFKNIWKILFFKCSIKINLKILDKNRLPKCSKNIAFKTFDKNRFTQLLDKAWFKNVRQKFIYTYVLQKLI